MACATTILQRSLTTLAGLGFIAAVSLWVRSHFVCDLIGRESHVATWRDGSSRAVTPGRIDNWPIHHPTLSPTIVHVRFQQWGSSRGTVRWAREDHDVQMIQGSDYYFLVLNRATPESRDGAYNWSLPHDDPRTASLARDPSSGFPVPPLSSFKAVGVNFWHFRYALPQPPLASDVIYLDVPYWLPTVLSALIFAATLRPLRYARRRFRLRAGHCPHCNYDLRAHTTSNARCPECGQPTPPPDPADHPTSP
jgi:hypothetical protein